MRSGFVLGSCAAVVLLGSAVLGSREQVGDPLDGSQAAQKGGGGQARPAAAIYIGTPKLSGTEVFTFSYTVAGTPKKLKLEVADIFGELDHPNQADDPQTKGQKIKEAFDKQVAAGSSIKLSNHQGLIVFEVVGGVVTQVEVAGHTMEADLVVVGTTGGAISVGLLTLSGQVSGRSVYGDTPSLLTMRAGNEEIQIALRPGMTLGEVVAAVQTELHALHITAVVTSAGALQFHLPADQPALSVLADDPLLQTRYGVAVP